MRRTAIVIPTYNEAQNIRLLLHNILEMYPYVNVFVIDDNSPDGTGEIVRHLSISDKRITCIHRFKKEGIGPAYIRGFQEVLRKDYEWIIQMDADFSHHPRYIERFLKEVKNWDVVIGSRYIKGGGAKNWSWSRRLISRYGNIYAKFILKLPINDLTSGFRCFRSEVLRRIDLENIRSKGYIFQIEMLYKAYKKGFKIKEIPILFTDRKRGVTKMSLSIFLEAMGGVWRILRE